MQRNVFFLHSPRRQQHLDGLSFRLVAVAACAALFIGAPAWASGLAVTDTAKHTGDYGLEVTVGSTCTAGDDAVFDNHDVTGIESFEGCDTLTAHDDFVVTATGDATLTAGTKVILDNGFSVEAGGTLELQVDGSLTPFAWVQDDSPLSETSYNVEFYVNLDLLTVGAGDHVDHFVAYDAAGTSNLLLRIEPGGQVVLGARNDTGTYQWTSSVATIAGFNKVAIAWEAVAGAQPSLTVNDGTPESVLVNTATRRIDTMRWGAVAGVVTGTSGQIYQDDIISYR
jgi:hypothetical protein